MFWNNRKRLIEFAEYEAKANAKFQIDCADALERASNTLLTVLLSGGGGSLALAISLFNNNSAPWLIFGVALTSAYLFMLAALVALYCLQAQDMYPPGNDPKNIFNDKNILLGFMITREKELISKQFCIDQNRNRNLKVAKWLNRVNTWATCTPLVFILASSASFLLV